MENQYWVATYKEYETETANVIGATFGCLGGFIYETVDEAINAIKNDIEEYKVGLDGVIRVEEDEEELVWIVYRNNKKVCCWQPQYMKMSKEANDLD